MEEIIKKFNSVMEEYNEAFTNAKDEKEQDKVSKKYESIIEKAESEMEKEMEEVIQAENKSLEAEHKASEDELTALENENKTESELLIKFKTLVNEGLEDSKISKKFKESELIELGNEFNLEWTTKGTKLSKVIELIKILNK